MHGARGVTLIELITTISIMAIVTAIAAPTFSDLQRNAQRTTAVNSFFHGLFLARSESIKSGQVVTICKSIDGSNCNSTAAWHDGWMIFVNTDRDDLPERDEGEAILHVGSRWDGGTITSNRAAYSFRPFRQAVVNGTIIFCDPRGSAHARAIIISHTGRPRVAQRDSNNRPLRCAAA